MRHACGDLELPDDFSRAVNIPSKQGQRGPVTAALDELRSKEQEATLTCQQKQIEALPQHMPQEGPHAPNPQDQLAKFVRERLEMRKWCMFSRIALDFVGPPKKGTAPIAREKEIREFAKVNGWTAEINDTGLSVIFRKPKP